MITTCAACGKQLEHNAPRCVRCKSQYCDAACQHDHWRRGHKQMCKKIHRAGNAEQYHADKNYKEAVAEAVEALADGRRQQIEILNQALIKTKLHGELQAQMAKDPEQDAPPPRTFARGWLDGPDQDSRWSSLQ